MISVVISVVSLLLSLTIAWFTFNRGSVGMTRPALVGFLSEEGLPKIFMRSLLYATGKRGHIIESLYLKVRRGQVSQVFDFWVYGESRPELIGSGLKVGEDGIASNHYFLPPKDASFRFLAGQYMIEVHAKILNRRKPVVLSTVELVLSEEFSDACADSAMGVLFTWMPESGGYRSDINTHRGAGQARSVSGAGPFTLPGVKPAMPSTTSSSKRIFKAAPDKCGWRDSSEWS